MFKGRKDFGSRFVMCDELLMACAIDNSLIQKSERVYSSVNLQRGVLRGQAIIDWENHLKKQPNSTLVLDIDMNSLMLMLKTALRR